MSGQETQEINERAHEACVSMQTRPTGTNKTQKLEIRHLELKNKLGCQERVKSTCLLSYIPVEKC